MQKAERIIQVCLLAGFILFAQFYKLDKLPYRIWDEAHVAVNSYEMSKGGNPFVTTIGGQPDLSGTKPPLLVWIQALFIKVLGISEYSIRLPSVLAGILTTLLVSFLVFRISGNGWAGVTTGIVLCTAKGYLVDHGTRFGDYDAMLTLFTTSALVLFFLYTETGEEKKKNRYLLLFFICIVLAVLTKGIVVLLFGPALLLYCIFRGQLFTTLKSKVFYLGLLLFLVFGVGYYFLREHYNPGYIDNVLNNELGARYSKVLEEHAGPFSFYFDRIRTSKFGVWFWAIPTGFLLMFFNRDKRQFRLSLYSYVCAISFLLVISSSTSKLEWYDIPTYPLMAIIIGLLMHQLANITSAVLPFLKQRVAMLILLVVFSIQPVYELRSFIDREEFWFDKEFYKTSYYFRNEARSNSRKFEGITYVDRGYIGMAWILYIYEMNDRHNMNIKRIYEWDPFNFKTGDRVLINFGPPAQRFESMYNYELEEQTGEIRIYKVLGLKSAG